jgi:hypothetical protein
MTDYYNLTYGPGFEGFLNWTNGTTEGWMATAFLFFIYLASFFVLSKSQFKSSANSSFAFLITFIAMIIMKLFLTINEIATYGIIFGLGISIIWMVID